MIIIDLWYTFQITVEEKTSEMIVILKTTYTSLFVYINLRGKLQKHTFIPAV